MTGFNGHCPFCGSENTEVKDSTSPAWGNNDEGDMTETWECLDCNKQWNTEARVNVVHRKLEFIIACPYCREDDKLELKSQDLQIEVYECNRCTRTFAIHTEEFYRRGSE